MKFKATVFRLEPQDVGPARSGWYYSCACPKIQKMERPVGPFDSEKIAKKVAALHNRAEPNH